MPSSLNNIPPHFQLRKEPKQKRSREAYEKILDAAIDIAADSGLSGVNTNAIAERAGLDVASVYRTFPNKEAILYWAANRWLARIRSVCDTMDGEDYRELNWRAFLVEFGEQVNRHMVHREAYRPLQNLWTSEPGFQALLAQHYDYLVAFYVRHFQRFGASLDEARLGHLAYYLVTSSDLIRNLLPTQSAERQQAVYELDYQTWMLHLSQVLPD